MIARDRVPDEADAGIPASRRKSRDTERPSSTPRRKPLVLLVDHDPDALDIYDTILRHHGYETVLAADGKEAVQPPSPPAPFR